MTWPILFGVGAWDRRQIATIGDVSSWDYWEAEMGSRSQQAGTAGTVTSRLLQNEHTTIPQILKSRFRRLGFDENNLRNRFGKSA